MITKTLIAAAAVSAIAFGAAAPANAKVDVDLYFGGFGPGYYEPAYPVYDEPSYYDEEYRPRRRHRAYSGISCDEGSQSVRNVGFRKVRPIDCSGRSYTYKARRHGNPFVVKVSSRNGRVISVQEAW